MDFEIVPKVLMANPFTEDIKIRFKEKFEWENAEVKTPTLTNMKQMNFSFFYF